MIIKKFKLFCGLVAIAGLTAITTIPAMAATDAEIEANIDRLLSQMTLDEKVGQLNQLSGTGYSDGMIRDIRAGKIGSILNEVDAETVNKLQREAMENTRLHIPIIFSRDVIHGFKTIFPIFICSILYHGYVFVGYFAKRTIGFLRVLHSRTII